jgi:hypothetical protein
VRGAAGAGRAARRRPETGGSASGALHRGWVSLRGSVAGYSDKTMLEECERGEDVALERYRDALDEALPDQVRMLIERQYEGVKRNHCAGSQPARPGARCAGLTWPLRGALGHPLSLDEAARPVRALPCALQRASACGPTMRLKTIWSLASKPRLRGWTTIASSMGAALAYYTMFSIAPAAADRDLVAGLLFGEQAARGEILVQLESLMGPDGARAVQALLESVNQPATGKWATLFGVGALVVGATDRVRRTAELARSDLARAGATAASRGSGAGCARASSRSA